MADTKISALTAATTPLDGTEVVPIVQSGVTKKVANNDFRPKQIQSNATNGVLQVVGPAAASTRVMTIPDANFTVARIDATNTFAADQNVTGTLTATYVRSNNASGTAQVTARNVNDYFGFYTQSGQSKMFFYDAYNGVDLFNVSGSTKDLTLNAGNFVQGTAAKGFNFTANSYAAGKTSQLLNWYEEGTWNVDIEGATTAGTNTNLVRYATYTRIGRQVTVNFYVRWESATGTGTLLITGLPYASRNEAGYYYSGGMGYTNLAYTAGNTPVLYLTHNRTKIDVNQLVPGGAAIGVPVPATGLIIGQITYFV